MKALPSTLGLPSDVDDLIDVLSSPAGGEVLSRAVKAVSGLYSQLSWVRTAPVPREDAIVIDGLCDACDATLDFFNSVPSWLANKEAQESQGEW